MHAALMDYYKLRGLYNEGELSRMEFESSQSTSKITELRTEMDRSMQAITSFVTQQLHGVHQADGGAAIKRAGNAGRVPRKPQAAVSRESSVIIKPETSGPRLPTTVTVQ